VALAYERGHAQDGADLLGQIGLAGLGLRAALGAHGFLLKDLGRGDLESAIRAVHAG